MAHITTHTHVGVFNTRQLRPHREPTLDHFQGSMAADLNAKPAREDRQRRVSAEETECAETGQRPMDEEECSLDDTEETKRDDTFRHREDSTTTRTDDENRDVSNIVGIGGSPASDNRSRSESFGPDSSTRSISDNEDEETDALTGLLTPPSEIRMYHINSVTVSKLEMPENNMRKDQATNTQEINYIETEDRETQTPGTNQDEYGSQSVGDIKPGRGFSDGNTYESPGVGTTNRHRSSMETSTNGETVDKESDITTCGCLLETEIRLNGVSTLALIDTGAQTSVITTEKIRRITNAGTKLIIKTGESILLTSVGNDQSHEISHYAFVFLEFGTQIIDKYIPVIKSIQNDLIIGLDIIRMIVKSIQITSKKLVLQNNKILRLISTKCCKNIPYSRKRKLASTRVPIYSSKIISNENNSPQSILTDNYLNSEFNNVFIKHKKLKNDNGHLRTDEMTILHTWLGAPKEGVDPATPQTRTTPKARPAVTSVSEHTSAYTHRTEETTSFSAQNTMADKEIQRALDEQRKLIKRNQELEDELKTIEKEQLLNIVAENKKLREDIKKKEHMLKEKKHARSATRELSPQPSTSRDAYKRDSSHKKTRCERLSVRQNVPFFGRVKIREQKKPEIVKKCEKQILIKLERCDDKLKNIESVQYTEQTSDVITKKAKPRKLHPKKAERFRNRYRDTRRKSMEVQRQIDIMQEQNAITQNLNKQIQEQLYALLNERRAVHLQTSIRLSIHR